MQIFNLFLHGHDTVLHASNYALSASDYVMCPVRCSQFEVLLHTILTTEWQHNDDKYISRGSSVSFM